MLPSLPIAERQALRAKVAEKLQIDKNPALNRVRQMLDVWCQEIRPDFLPLQAMQLDLFMPGLSDRPWLDTERYTFVPELESHYSEIRDAYFRAQDLKLKHYLSATENPNPGFPDGWKELLLARAGAELEENIAHFPYLRQLHRKLLREYSFITQLTFLVLESGTVIQPHIDPWNCFVEVHMGIQVPAGDCAIKVGSVTHRWREGRCLSFDNSFYHTAWNHTQETRVILSIHLPHPGLEKREREVLAELPDMLGTSQATSA